VVDPPFEVVEPPAGEVPVVVEVPHAGVRLDPETLGYTVVPAHAIARDADLFVDELFQDAPARGATLVRANMSRFVVDLNRGPEDYDAEAVEGGSRAPWPRGLVWRLATDGERVLSQRLPPSELERRLSAYYRPYHTAVEGLLERKRAKFGYAILLCAHSMPSRTRRGPIESTARADIVPGTRGRTTACAAVIDAVDACARAHGYAVRHDDPYKGGFSTGHYGRPADRWHAIQVEITRRIYMDELRCRIDPQGFRAVRHFATKLVECLAHLDLAPRAGGAPAAPAGRTP
jgi:N-formylglutamate amidohydrolase